MPVFQQARLAKLWDGPLQTLSKRQRSVPESLDGEIVDEVVKMVRDKIGPVAAFKTATIVGRLPKTRSGKILRGTMQRIANGQEYKMPATIDDPAILGEITEALKGVGYPSSA